MKEKFDFNDILIQMSITSPINSRRKEVKNIYKDGKLPLFASPMDTVVGYKNYKKYLNSNINVCLPRGEKKIKGKFVFNSYSLTDIENIIKGNDKLVGKCVLIDIANGHMVKLEKMTKELKEKFPDITLMVGNIANVKTYRKLSVAGADFIRVGIGFGSGCLTTEKTGCGYPMASLIHECYNEKCKMGDSGKVGAKIVADGGFKKEADIIKALALGADYVMLGGIFNKALESSGSNYIFKHIKVNEQIAKYAFKNGLKVKKKFRGMATKDVQRKWGNKILKTSEGVKRINSVEYTLNSWVENFSDYLKSSMSYTGSRNLGEFIGKVKFNLITNESYKRFNK